MASARACTARNRNEVRRKAQRPVPPAGSWARKKPYGAAGVPAPGGADTEVSGPPTCLLWRLCTAGRGGASLGLRETQPRGLLRVCGRTAVYLSRREAGGLTGGQGWTGEASAPSPVCFWRIRAHRPTTSKKQHRQAAAAGTARGRWWLKQMDERHGVGRSDARMRGRGSSMGAGKGDPSLGRMEYSRKVLTSKLRPARHGCCRRPVGIQTRGGWLVESGRQGRWEGLGWHIALEQK